MALYKWDALGVICTWETGYHSSEEGPCEHSCHSLHTSLLLWLMLAPCGRNTPDSAKVDWCHLRLILATKYERWRGWELGVRANHSGEESIRVNESVASDVLLERRTCLLIWGLRFPVCKTREVKPHIWKVPPSFNILYPILLGVTLKATVTQRLCQWIAAFKVKILFSGKESSLFQ